MEIADVMSNMRNGHSNLIPDDLAGVCGNINVLIGACESNVALKLMSRTMYEIALEHLHGQAPEGWLATPMPRPALDMYASCPLGSLTPYSDDLSWNCHRTITLVGIGPE
jgi:hypothetical protein